MSSTNTLVPFQASLEDGRPRCRCRAWRSGTGQQCKKPAKTDGICGTHLNLHRACGYYDEPRPTIWGTSHDGSHIELGSDLEKHRGEPIPWVSNDTETREVTTGSGNTGKTSDGDNARDGSNHIVFSRDGVNFHGDMGAGGAIIITGVKKLTRFRNEPAEELLKRGIDVPDGCRVVTSWTDYDMKFKEALDRPENIKLKDKFNKYPNCSKKMYAFIHMSPGAPGEGALLDLIRESVDW